MSRRTLEGRPAGRSRLRRAPERPVLGALLALACVTGSVPAHATEDLGGDAPVRLAETQRSPEGTPKVHLDRLDLPDVPGAAGYKKHLEKFLRKEARRLDWGAGKDNRIEYRLEVVELELRRKGDVLEVRCSAVGRLPNQRTARSRLTFGGDPAREREVVQQVLEIVSRGVLTRLASLERRRRGLP